MVGERGKGSALEPYDRTAYLDDAWAEEGDQAVVQEVLLKRLVMTRKKEGARTEYTQRESVQQSHTDGAHSSAVTHACMPRTSARVRE